MGVFDWLTGGKKEEARASETTRKKQEEINRALQQSAQKRKTRQQEMAAFESLPYLERQGRIRGAGPSGKVAESGYYPGVWEGGGDMTPITTEYLEQKFPSGQIQQAQQKAGFFESVGIDLRRIEAMTLIGQLPTAIAAKANPVALALFDKLRGISSVVISTIATGGALTYLSGGILGGSATASANAVAAKTGISLSTAGKLAVNPKTIGLATKILGKVFSTKALAFYGAWAGSVFLGKWGQAEAAEPITIPLRDAMWEANKTGDWRIYNEYQAAAEEITRIPIWEEIMSWSPLSAVPGILRKIKGVRTGVQLLGELADQKRGAIF